MDQQLQWSVTSETLLAAKGEERGTLRKWCDDHSGGQAQLEALI
eukprot:CAMPEP_0171508496 /NCGR_PEP_ID=MMETSP0958-20121227/14196_1 /TAXON_ID=87120 /ORGANISM="Aurantiochytrium limacinum, Strain ATCCMYA-1381" /LENGTH=43 /DNA_ID= /DNA_START= /DNA_END= /DNA_ORIENTATION=